MNLKTILLPEGLMEIGYEAFCNNQYLQRITLPSRVAYIGGRAFAECYLLSEVTLLPETPPNCGKEAFSDSWGGVSYPIYVPSGSLAAYKAAPGWSDYANRIQAMP